jgi:hypothetical protein
MKVIDNITSTTVEKLKVIVDLLKNADQDDPIDTLVKLKNFSSVQSSSEEGKA